MISKETGLEQVNTPANESPEEKNDGDYYLTVGELIEQLKTLDPNWIVAHDWDAGFEELTGVEVVDVTVDKSSMWIWHATPEPENTSLLICRSIKRVPYKEVPFRSIQTGDTK